MIGHGLGPGGNFGWWRLKVNIFERKAKAANHAITVRAQEDASIVEMG
jgi:hypothetical protein